MAHAVEGEVQEVSQDVDVTIDIDNLVLLSLTLSLSLSLSRLTSFSGRQRTRVPQPRRITVLGLASRGVQEPEREPAEKDHGASPRKQGRPRARARASEKCYQLAGRPSEEVRAAEELRG